MGPRLLPAERAALLAASLASFLTPFMGASANVALPSIARDLGLDALQMSWIATVFLLAAAVFLVPFGRLADIRGRRRVLTWGILTYTLGSAASALAPTALFLIGARAVQGVGGAMMFGTSVAVLTSVFRPERRGAALGINVASVYLGLSLGPVLGGVLTDQLGWRSIFVVNAALAGVTGFVVVSKLEGEWAPARGERVDVVGSAVYAVALAALMFGFSRPPGLAGALWIACGLASLAGFVKLQLAHPSPVLDVRLFTGNRVFGLSNLAALVNYSATFAVGFLLSLYLQYVRGFSAQHAGAILLSQPIVQVVVSPLAGRLSDRVEPRLVASAGMLLTVAGLLLLSPLTDATPMAYIVGCLAVLGAGFGLFSSPNTNAVMAAVESRQYGLAAATLGTMRLGGQMLSMGIAMLALSVFVGAVTLSSAHHQGLISATRVTFLAFAISCLAGTAASLARGRSAPPGASSRTAR
jgi:EmrB/QacA subfamily drug resistance transporter